MIYMFLNDKGFEETQVFIDYTQASPTHGRLSEEQYNYFSHKVIVPDARVSRVSIQSNILEKECGLVFDKENLTVNDAKILTCSSDQFGIIFNIMEELVFSQDAASVIESQLIGDTVTFAGYVPGSKLISTQKEICTIYKKNGTSVDISIPDYVVFQMQIDGTTYDFKIFIKAAVFGSDYPFCSIKKILPPFAPEILLDPIFLNDLDAVNRSQSNINKLLNEAMQSDDYNGVLTHTTRFKHENYSTAPELYFGILYIGRKPTALEIRKSICEFLENSGTGTHDVWRAVFPELYVANQMFLIPIWDNETPRPNLIINPSILPLKDLHDNLGIILNEMPESHIQEHTDIITDMTDNLFSMVISDEKNNEYHSFKELHPTYMAVPTTHQSFFSQAPETRAFSKRFAGALIVLQGGDDVNYSVNFFYGREFRSFVEGDVEYHVLTRASYEAALNIQKGE